MVAVAYLKAFMILFISTISVFAFMLPKLWAFQYPKIIPEIFTPTHRSSGRKEGSGQGDDELADAKVEP